MTKTLIISIMITLVCAAGLYPQEEDESLTCGWFCQLDRWLEETDSVVQGYVEAGERSVVEDFEEASADTEYSYMKYHLKFSQEINKRFGYKVGWDVYDKDYEDVDNLDNISRTFKAGIDYVLWQGDKRSLQLDFDFLCREKRYFNMPTYEYDRIMAAPSLSFKADGLYTAKLTAGLDRYEYLEASYKDEFIPFAKAEGKRYLLDRDLMLTGSYRIKTSRRVEQGREKIQRDIRAGADYKFDLPGIYKAMARVGWGNRDTREDEELDEDYDYDYYYWYVKTDHKIGDTVKTHLKYRFFEKDYDTAGYDHKGFFVRNGWDFEALDSKVHRAWWGIDLEHKQVRYDLQPSGDYRKETVEAAGNYKRKKNFKLTAGIQASLYDYKDPAKDKKRYYTVLSGEKLLQDGDLSLSLHLKYRHTDMDDQNSDNKTAIRTEARWRF